MADLVYVAIILAFTAICIAYIGWCDRIIGPDQPDTASDPSADTSSVDPTKDPVTL